MAYQLSPIIALTSPALWMEGSPYTKEKIYSIEEGKVPPVNYDSHQLKPHSLTHIETPRHTQAEGNTLDYYLKNYPEYFYGPCAVVKLPLNNYRPTPLAPNHYHWIVTKQELQQAVYELLGSEIPPNKLLLTTDFYPKNSSGYHDPNYVLTLSQEAADWLVSQDVHLYGTSWKSSDFNPGKIDRPIHNTLFSKALIVECLALDHVPAGRYFYVGSPIALEDASESCVNPILLEAHELHL